MPFMNALVYTVCGTDFTGRPTFLHQQVDILCDDECSAEPPFDPECLEIAHRDRLAESWRSALEPGIHYMQRHARSGAVQLKPLRPAGLGVQ